MPRSRVSDAALNAAIPVVARWCARLGGPWVDPEDAAQDVLIIAMRRLGTLKEPSLLEPWLYGITRRVLAAHRRRVWWRRWVPGPAPERVALSDPEGDAMVEQRATTLRAWLERLPASQREVVVLCRLEDRPATEVAALLGVPVGTVKSRLRLAMRRLRALAEEER